MSQAQASPSADRPRRSRRYRIALLVAVWLILAAALAIWLHGFRTPAPKGIPDLSTANSVIYVRRNKPSSGWALVYHFHSRDEVQRIAGELKTAKPWNDVNRSRIGLSTDHMIVFLDKVAGKAHVRQMFFIMGDSLLYERDAASDRSYSGVNILKTIEHIIQESNTQPLSLEAVHALPPDVIYGSLAPQGWQDPHVPQPRTPP